MSEPRVEVVCDSPLWESVPEIQALATRAAIAAEAGAGVAVRLGAEIALLLTDDAAIRELNRAWRGVDRPTNVLSFPAVESSALAAAPHLGDVAVAFETVRREAAAEGKTLADHAVHLVVHGVLHLLGRDHTLDGEAQAMESLEIAILAGLGVADPYADAAGLADISAGGH